MPVIPLAIVQAGYEATPGTLVAATRVVDMEPGQAQLKFDQDIITVSRAGSLATAHQAYAGPYVAAVDFKNLPASYTDLPWFANHFSTPMTTGAGATADKTYTNLPHDTTDDHKRSSMELGGKDTWPTEYKVAGCAGVSFALKIDRKGLWRMDASFVGMALTKAAKTGALSARSCKHIPGAGTKVYIDASTFGSTVITARLMSGEFDDTEAKSPDDIIDGLAADALAPTSISIHGKRKVTAKLKLLFTAVTEWDAFRAATVQKVRVFQQGPVLGSSFWSATLDIPGAWQTYSLGDAGGLMTAEIGLGALYDPTLAADWKLVTVNDQTTLV